MLSPYAKREWITLLVIGALVTATFGAVGWWWAMGIVVVVAVAVLSFFRDPNRRTPTERGAVVSPADGRVSSIHHLDHFAPLGGPAVCIRVFLSVFNVHLVRCPCHGVVDSMTHTPGKHLNVLNPRSAEVNESHLTALLHPIRRYPVASVRQVAGLIARSIHCAVEPEQILQRGQRMGIIKLGSTVELYLPDTLKPTIRIKQGQRVLGGVTVVAAVTPLPIQPEEATSPPQISTNKPDMVDRSNTLAPVTEQSGP